MSSDPGASSATPSGASNTNKKASSVAPTPGGAQKKSSGAAAGKAGKGAPSRPSSARKPSASGSGAAAAAGSGLQGELRSFVSQHPDGWSHHDWMRLLERLRERGIDSGDTDRIGMQLEKERLSQVLSTKKVSGLGPSKLRAVIDRFETLWSLRRASVDEIAGISGFNRQLAEKVHEAVQ